MSNTHYSLLPIIFVIVPKIRYLSRKSYFHGRPLFLHLISFCIFSPNIHLFKVRLHNPRICFVRLNGSEMEWNKRLRSFFTFELIVQFQGNVSVVKRSQFYILHNDNDL